MLTANSDSFKTGYGNLIIFAIVLNAMHAHCIGIINKTLSTDTHSNGYISEACCNGDRRANCIVRVFLAFAATRTWRFLDASLERKRISLARRAQ